MPADQLRDWLTKVGWEIALTTAIAASLAVSTDGTVAQFFRYLAGISGLFSLASVVVAVGRKRRLATRLSEWDEAILLATLSAGSHLIATQIGNPR